jgi:hypothetical protein
MKIIGSTPDDENEAKVVKRLEECLTMHVGENSLIFPKVYGGYVVDRDIEIVLYMYPKGPSSWKSKDYHIKNALICIEVKGHRKIEFSSSTNVVVETMGVNGYPVEQARKSSQALRRIIEKAGSTQISWVYYLACFPNVHFESLTMREQESIAKHNQRPFVLFGDEIRHDAVIERLSMQAKATGKATGSYVSSFYGEDAVSKKVALKLPEILSGVPESIVVGSFDRARFERISKSKIQISEYVKGIDDGDIVLQGKAGSGKSVALVRLALHYQAHGFNVLLCTYNIALAADLKRQLIYYRDQADQQMHLLGTDRGQIDVTNVDALISEYARLVSSFSTDLSKVDTSWNGPTKLDSRFSQLLLSNIRSFELDR